MKYKSVATANPDRSKRVMRWVYSLAILTMIPAIYLTIRMLDANKLNVEIDRFVADECRFPATQVLSKKYYTSDGERYLQLTLIGRTLPVDSLVMALEPRLRYYDLGNIKLEFIQGGEISSPANDWRFESTADFYQLTQATISRQEEIIDSLRTLVTDEREAGGAGVRIAPEIHVLFPDVKDIAVSRSIFASTEPVAGKAATDTVTVALVYMQRPLSKPDMNRFREYLCARLAVSAIEIVAVPRP